MSGWSTGIPPYNRFIVSGSDDRAARLWDLATSALLHTFKGHGRVIYALAFTPDSKIMASVSNDWTVKL